VGGFGKITRRGATQTLFYVSLAMFAFWLWFSGSSRIDVWPEEEGVPAAGLSIRDMQGGWVEIDEFRGQVVLLNMWASWCGPCRNEIPGLARIHREYGSGGLVVIGVNVDDVPAGDVIRIAEQLEIPYTVVVRGDTFRGPFKTGGTIPHTWLVDRRGMVRASHSGYVSDDSLDAACRVLLLER